MTEKTPRQTIRAATECMAMNLIDYDNQSDEDLPAGGIKQAVRDGAATPEEIIEWFTVELLRGLGMERR